jgi:hypothetical protein
MFAPARLAFASADAATPVFDAVEAAAVRLGAADPLSSLDSARSRLGRWLFGERRLPLANDRLEALRRLAVQLRHAQTPSPRQVSAARRAGVTDLQLHMLWTLFRATGAGRRAA